MDDELKIKLISNLQCGLGEGPAFDHRNDTFYQVDCQQKKIIKVTFKGSDAVPDCKRATLDNPQSSVQDCSEIRSIQQRDFDAMPTIVIPIEEDENLLLISLGQRLAILDFDDNKILDQIDFSEVLQDKERFNDGKCDKQGRLFIGTLYEESDGTMPAGKGALYRLDGRQLTRIFSNTHISNGIAWTRDDTKMFFNDSGTRVIHQFDYDLQSGEIRNGRPLVDLKETELEGGETSSIETPDGMTIDAQDKLWIALWDGNRLIRFCPQICKVLQSITTGSSRTTSVCNGKLFGKDALFVTSASNPADPEKKRSGRSFVVYSSRGTNFLGINSNFFRRSLLTN